MRIKNVRTIIDGNKITLVADCKVRPVGTDEIYFTFDKKYKDWFYEDASPFAATLLIPSMYFGEDLIIEGSISEKLYQGMLEVVEMMSGWNLGMKRVNIKADKIVPDTVRPQKVATFFSGGVDSFYTYLKHKLDKTDPIAYFILMRGTDIDFSNDELWEATKNNVKNIAWEDNIELIEVETNAQIILEPILSADFTHGGILAATGLCLRRGLKKIYIPSTFTREENIPYGSHPDLDKLWSTESIFFDHDGFEASRVNKVAWQIAKSPLALKYLRVCYMNVKDAYNCGKCDKCTRTMINLYAVGKLCEAKTFPHHIDYENVTRLVTNSAGFGRYCHHDNLKFLKENKVDPELQQAIEKGLAEVRVATSEKVIKTVRYLDHMYLRSFLYKLWTGYLRDKVKSS